MGDDMNTNTNTNTNQIKKWMTSHYQEHIDDQTGILCMTTLAEDCSNTLFNKEANETMFEIAHEVGEKFNLLY